MDRKQLSIDMQTSADHLSDQAFKKIFQIKIVFEIQDETINLSHICNMLIKKLKIPAFDIYFLDKRVSLHLKTNVF